MSRRRLSDDEHALWKGFVRAITPLQQNRSAGKQGDAGTVAPAHKSARQESRRQPPQPVKPLPLAPFDRRLRHRVARGRETIDARIDLHGMTQREARAELLRFLHRAQENDAKLALVVTGKGTGKLAREAQNERGVLRRNVPIWLSLPEFRRFVVSFEEAHPNHGGHGALYLRIRRRVGTPNARQ